MALVNNNYIFWALAAHTLKWSYIIISTGHVLTSAISDQRHRNTLCLLLTVRLTRLVSAHSPVCLVLALPLNANKALRTRVAKFQKDLLEAKVAGVDESIFMAPNRLHITLGIMTLGGSSAKTVETALNLLRALQPSIADLLQGKNSVKVKLNSLEILKQDKEATQVLVIGTPDDDDGKQLKAVCGEFQPVYSANQPTPHRTHPQSIHRGRVHRTT